MSWIGSGINDYDRIESVDCEHEDDETGKVCGFSGDVDVFYGDYTRSWDCPECGFEHQEDYDRHSRFDDC